MSKTKYELMEQKLIDASVERGMPELVEEWFIEYIKSVDTDITQKGWYLTPTSPRYFGDVGIYLGTNYEVASKNLDYWLQLID